MHTTVILAVLGIMVILGAIFITVEFIGEPGSKKRTIVFSIICLIIVIGLIIVWILRNALL